MGAGTLLLQLGTTLAATVAVVGMAQITPYGKDNVGHKQEIADVVKCKDAKDHIVDGTDSSES